MYATHRVVYVRSIAQFSFVVNAFCPFYLLFVTSAKGAPRLFVQIDKFLKRRAPQRGSSFDLGLVNITAFSS
jgi:hypothetical protein